jgi:hypothetical protein
MRKRLLLIAPLLLLPLAACGGGGSTSNTAVTNLSVSKGQSLIDLKKALDSGVITQSEYDTQRRAILNGP